LKLVKILKLFISKYVRKKKKKTFLKKDIEEIIFKSNLIILKRKKKNYSRNIQRAFYIYERFFQLNEKKIILLFEGIFKFIIGGLFSLIK
jgi:hypothetical protein